MSDIQRKLATIRRIVEIRPIEGADNIEVATVDGWDVVVKKGEFEVGDLAVYFEIDSLLPMEPEFEFLRMSCYRKTAQQEGFKLRTIKLRGQVSQGLLIPLEIGKTIFYRRDGMYLTMAWAEGLDVTNMLGVEKWIENIPVELAGDVEGRFPSFIPRTDEERIQNLTSKWSQWKDQHHFYATEKLDGTSFTCFLKEGEFGVCSRNWQIKETEGNLQWKIARELDLEQKLRGLNRNIAIQGELIGHGIQKNIYNLSKHTINVFSVYDIDAQKYLPYLQLIEVVANLELSIAPLLFWNKGLSDFSVQDLVQYADDKSVLNPKADREGIVVRAMEDSSISFKVISNKFLAKQKD